MSRALDELERLLGSRALRAPEQLERYGRDEFVLGAFPPEGRWRWCKASRRSPSPNARPYVSCVSASGDC
jgi:hypothetical protein